MQSYKDLNIDFKGRKDEKLDIRNKNLNSLKGCPQHIPDCFYCSDNQLTSLLYGPKQIGHWYDCSNNHLTDLYGCAQSGITQLFCSNNKLTTLTGGPSSTEWGYDCRNNKLTDLYGCASHIGSDLDFQYNNITSLIGIHKIIKSCRETYFDCEKITEGGIGLLLISKLKEISVNTEPFKIISKYLGQGTKGLVLCQNELIEHGYDNYAKL